MKRIKKNSLVIIDDFSINNRKNYSGSQASVSIIRAISLNEIGSGDVFRIIFKEFRVAVLVGITLVFCNFIKMMLLDHVAIMVAAVVCLALIVTVIIAKIIGCLLPVFANRLGFDSAVMAGPFITTIVDSLSLLIYFTIATSLLNL